MRNWKTTLGGLLLTAGTALAAMEGSTLRSIGYICMGAGGLMLGVSAQDKK